MDGTSGSPIKAFLRKHSPIKTRSKTQQTATRDAPSPTKERVPMRDLSTNTSPTKDGKVSKRKFSGFMRNKPTHNEEAVPPVPTTKHRRISSVPGKVQRENEQPPPLPDNPHLSSRVQQLEAELEAARAELANSATTSSSTRKAISPRRVRPKTPRRAHSYDAHGNSDQEAAERHERLTRGTKFGGLVESLLEPDYASANARAASYSTRGGPAEIRQGGLESRRHSAMASYGDLERQCMDDEDDDAERLKRKRSELRAAEWKRIQEAYGHSPQRVLSSGTKRSRDTITTTHDEPPARRQKQTHDLPQDKSMPKGPQHTRRVASESHAPSTLELTRGSIKPIQSEPYKIEYVRTNTQTPDRPKAQAPRRTPPKGRPTYDLMKAFGSNTPKEPTNGKANENVEVFKAGEDEPEEKDIEQRPNTPWRRNPPSPSRLQTVNEEFEWDDEVF